MADTSSEAYVAVRIVYDGPPAAGKTTSLRALARGFGREVVTPEELGGRTAYFDWMEYIGGRFSGAQIRCEVMTVPGQACWANRRALLLERADVVVFVGDTTPEAWPESLARLAALRSHIDQGAAARGGVRVGLVFQANKRDHADAVPIALIRQQVEPHRIAGDRVRRQRGDGVRETFVFAIRLALDRLRELGLQPERDTMTADQLLELLKRSEAAPPEATLDEAWSQAAPPATPEVVEPPRPQLRIVRPELPALPAVPAVPAPTLARLTAIAPSHEVPTGCVWPPVDGRVILHEAAAVRATPRRTQNGDWVAGLGAGWRLHSHVDARFDDLEAGRTALIEWARQHALAEPLLSRDRSIVLSSDTVGWRLWQIVKTAPSLREQFLDHEGSPDQLLAGVVRTARLLAAAVTLCRIHRLGLRCAADTIGVDELDQPAYIALMPPALGASTELPADAPLWVAEQLASLLASDERQLVRDQLDALPPYELGSLDGRRIADRLREVLEVSA